jgi:hypothetical protein
MLKKVNGVNSEEVVELSESMTAAWQQVEVLSRAKSDLDKQIKGHKAMIMHAMGTAGVGKMTDGRCMIRKKITRKSKEMPAIEFFRLMCRK